MSDDDLSKPTPKPKGGARKGAGRKPNNLKKERLTRELAEQGLQNALRMGLSPLDVMRARMLAEPLSNGMMVSKEQFEAAVACAPYLHPKLAYAVVKDVTSSAPTTSVERIRRIEQLLLETTADDEADQGTIESGAVEVEPE